MKRLKGKVAIVTAGASGIGKATAIKMAQEGAKVVIADFNEKGAKQVAKEIEMSNGIALGIFLDGAKEESIKQMVDSTIEHFDEIHILHNNIGTTNIKVDLDVIRTDLDEFDRVMNINAKSIIKAGKYVIPHMIKNGGGSIINTASIGGIAGDVIRTAYSASKATVISLTKSIATQYGKNNIRCNAVAPGLILTPAARNTLPSEVMDMFLKYNCLPYHGEATDIANAVVFFASDESKFITGQTLAVEGGHLTPAPTTFEFGKYIKFD